MAPDGLYRLGLGGRFTGIPGPKTLQVVRPTARRGRRMASGRPAIVVGSAGRIPRSLYPGGHSQKRRFQCRHNEGAGYFQVNQKRGVRWSAAHAFLHPVKDRPNLTVLTHAQAKKLTVADGRVTGVDFWLDGTDAHASAAREVVLACGSVGSPQILQLSGIGPGALLRDHGIDVAH